MQAVQISSRKVRGSVIRTTLPNTWTQLVGAKPGDYIDFSIKGEMLIIQLRKMIRDGAAKERE